MTEEESIVTARLRAIEIAELVALRDSIKTLTNLMELILIDPKDAAFYTKTKELEAQIKASKE